MRKNIDITDLVRRYEAGETVLGLSKHYGIARTGIIPRLKYAGCRIRGRTETMTAILAARYKDSTPEERLRITEAAHAAVRGKKQGIKQRIKIALANEANARQSHLEKWFCSKLAESVISFVPQKCVGPYNVDIALTESRIAVEIFGGHWHRAGRHAKRFRERTDYLIDAGWLPVIVWSVSDKPLGAGAIDYIVSLHERICRGEPGGCQEHVIWGTGECLPADQYDPNTGSTIVRFKGSYRVRDENGRFTK
jgi:very-short-patch-repair endonuclease